MEKRVVITGMGMITPLGAGCEDTWRKMLHGDSGASRITLFDAATFPTKIAAEVKDCDFSEFIGKNDSLRFTGRNTQFAILAADSAFKDAGLDAYDYDPRRLGVYLGSGEGNQDFFNYVRIIAQSWTGSSISTAKFLELGKRAFNPLKEIEQEPNMAAAHLARIFRAYGPNVNCLTACAAGSQAIGEAAELVLMGKADMMICGGTHSMIHPLGITAFNLLTAL